MQVVFVFILILCFSCVFCSFQTEYKASNNNIDFDHGQTIRNCSLEPVDQDIRKKLAQLLENGKKVIFIHILFTGNAQQMLEKYNGDLFKPMEWVRTSGRRGTSLLYLRPQFEQLSLSTLSFETGHLDVELMQTSNNCVDSADGTVLERKLNELLLLDFQTNTGVDGSLSESEYVCSIHIREDNSYSVFYYRCCHENQDKRIVCKDLVYDLWIDLLFRCIFFINVIVFMFSPYLIPASFYRKVYGQYMYEHKLLAPLKLRISKTTTKSSKADNMVPLHKIKHMDKLYQWIKKQYPETILTVPLTKIQIATNYQRLVSGNYVPVSVLKTFYSMFIQCKIRKSSSFGKCCKGSIFGTVFQHSEEQTCKGATESVPSDKHPWYRSLRHFMRLLMLLTLSLPWIIRMFFFYSYEKGYINDMKRASERRNLTLPIQWNLTTRLSPLHVLFLICYIMFCLDALVFGVASHNIKQKLQFLMRKCVRDMREISKLKALEWSVTILLVPFEKFGIFGIFLAGFYFIFAIPVIVSVLAFYCLPTVNLVLRLLAHFVAYLIPNEGSVISRSTCIVCRKILDSIHTHFHMDILTKREHIEKPPQSISIKSRFTQLIVLPLCLLTVLSFVFLTMEIMVFFIEIFIYSIIGIIMNASSVLKYISLVFMLVLYARDCFNGVSEKYLEFNKSINRLIVDMAREKVEVIAGSDEQKNTAFQICTDSSETFDKDTENVKLVVKNGVPKWHINRLILFLDAQDKPYLTEKFFLKACYMDAVGVPGPLITNLVNAAWRFLCIFLFLMFVVLIVLAFGDEYQISGTNQMLATLAGGFLPWVFRNILFKPKDALILDTKNLSFKSNLKSLIEEYSQTWDIFDVELDENKESGIEVHNTHKQEAGDDGTTNDTTALMPNIAADNIQTFDLIIYDDKTKVLTV